MKLLVSNLAISWSRIILSTWNFDTAVNQAWEGSTSALDSVETAARTCQTLQCDRSVGWGNHPDENGEVTLDAMIMDGKNMNVGSVVGLRRVKNAVGVARKVLDHTTHKQVRRRILRAFRILTKQVHFCISTFYNIPRNFSTQL